MQFFTWMLTHFSCPTWHEFGNFLKAWTPRPLLLQLQTPKGRWKFGCTTHQRSPSTATEVFKFDFFVLCLFVNAFSETGINAGIMLMNLTRMRDFKMEERAIAVEMLYGKRLLLADQDIYNIIFHFSPGVMMIFSWKVTRFLMFNALAQISYTSSTVPTIFTMYIALVTVPVQQERQEPCASVTRL